MGDPSKATGRYPFVYDSFEVERLDHQSKFYDDLTRCFLIAAGLANAKKILEVGCGSGAVLRILRSLAPDAEIFGLDASEEALAAARVRCPSATLIHDNYEHFVPESRFGAVIGRFTMIYATAPAEVLKKAASWVEPGGIIAFQEPDHESYYGTNFESEFFDKEREFMFRHALEHRLNPSIGLDLVGLLRAELGSQVNEIRLKRSEGGPESNIYRMLAWTSVGMWRKHLQDQGVHMSLEDAAQLLEKRTDEFRREAARCNGVLTASELVGAWAQVPIAQSKVVKGSPFLMPDSPS